MKLLNVRIDEELKELVDTAVAVSDAPDKSAWCREALTAGALKEIAEYQRANAHNVGIDGSAIPAPSLGRVSSAHRGFIEPVQASGCVHPPTARWIGVENESCLLCGATVRRRM